MRLWHAHRHSLDRGTSNQRSRCLLQLMLLALLLIHSGCREGDPESPSPLRDSPVEQKQEAKSLGGLPSIMIPTDRPPSDSRQTKINPTIWALLNDLRAKGITRSTITARHATSLSSRLVRMDPGGRIQVYIDVDQISPEILSQLKAMEGSIELTNPTLRIIQAWVPFDRIEELADRHSVKRIRPPDYGFPRSDTP